jgi:phosphohistidine phosphatase
MPTLILMRHAKAVREHEAPTDKARGLTERGRRDAAAAGLALVDSGLEIGCALISSAKRTRETWAESRLAAPDVRFQDALYLAGAEALYAAALGAGLGTVLVLAHNPGLNDLIATLIERSGDRSKLALSLSEHLPTAGIAAFNVDGDALASAQARFIFGWAPDRPD